MTEVLHATKRTEVGRNAVKQIRRAGRVPAVLYGHGEENVNLSISGAEIGAAVRHGSKMVTLQGDVNETALIREVQWDTYGSEVVHVDLARVSATEQVAVTIPLEIRGEAAGVREGGIVEMVAHEIHIRCPASAIPERLEVRVHDLHLGGSIKLGDLQLPDGATLISDPDGVAVHCVGRVEAEKEAAEVAAPAEPELIGRKPEADEEE